MIRSLLTIALALGSLLSAPVGASTPLVLTVSHQVGYAPLKLTTTARVASEYRGQTACIVIDGPQQTMSCFPVDAPQVTRVFTLGEEGEYLIWLEVGDNKQHIATPGITILVQ